MAEWYACLRYAWDIGDIITLIESPTHRNYKFE